MIIPALLATTKLLGVGGWGWALEPLQPPIGDAPAPVRNENARIKLALTIPTGAQITVANEMLPFVTDETMTYENSQKKQCIY